MSKPSSRKNSQDSTLLYFEAQDDEILLYQLAEAWEADLVKRHESDDARAALVESRTVSKVDVAINGSYEHDIEDTATLVLSDEDYKLSLEEVAQLEKSRRSSTQSPYERYRAQRNRLSVTDLVSPSWCELQFQYELEKGGRKRRTPAMKAGHELHDILEKEVHTVVEMTLDPDIEEEKLGLRLLNVLQGLIELQLTGISRELPVFGMVGDTFISGVIDQIRYEQKSEPKTREEQFMARYLQQDVLAGHVLVISDHKTRVARSEPSKGQTDQTRLQLMLYWHLYRAMPELTLERLTRVDSLDPDRTFSESFLHQASVILNSQANSAPRPSEEIAVNNLRSLWSAVQSKIARTVDTLSPVLRINYIHQATAEHISTKSFEVDAVWMKQKSADIMAWWHGARQPRGVVIEEASKCSYCQFEAGCSWRLAKIREGIERRQAHRGVQ